MLSGGIFDIPDQLKQIASLEEKTKQSQFWDEPDQAKNVLQQINDLKGWTEPLISIKEKLRSLHDLYQDALQLKDEEFLNELLDEIKPIDQELQKLEFKRMLSGKMDKNSCFLSINAGAGGTESCDWASMLTRMYQKFGASKKWTIEVIETTKGDEVGIKSITLKFTGSFAYGFLKAERGVHRLVRISPFDANKKRHTSFASIDVIPEIDQEITIEMKPEDLRIDTYRASGAGGQHINTTDSAVRITHLPTKIVVSCQNERSQVQNKEMCLKMLKAKLYTLKEQEQKESIEQLGGEKKEIGFGSQIRSYVFHPYSLVKDNRTKVEVGNVQMVMDGQIDVFIEEYLKQFG